MWRAIDSWQSRYTMFVVVALAINLIDGAVARSAVDPHRQLVLAIASTFDIVGVVLALYYWLLVRPGLRGRTSMLAVGLLGAARACYLYPGAGGITATLGALCELGLIGYVIAQFGSKGGDDSSKDPLEVIGAAVQRLVPIPALAHILRVELGIAYYAFLSWGEKPHIPENARVFTVYKKYGKTELLAVMPLACLFEIVPVHLVLHKWSPTVAWIATAISLYSIVWLVGLTRAFRLRPAFVDDAAIEIRYGLLFQLRVPRESIKQIRSAREEDYRFAVPRKTQPSLCIAFDRELRADGLFGRSRRLTRIAFTPDEPVTLIETQPAIRSADRS